MRTSVIEVDSSNTTFVDLTEQLREFCATEQDGLCNVFVPHATAGIAIFELGDGSDPDLEAAIDHLLPAEDIYVHSHGSKGHGRDHLVPAVISPSTSIPVMDGELQLGVWQHVVLVDTNRDNPHRTVRISFLPA